MSSVAARQPAQAPTVRWAILASHVSRDDIRFHLHLGTGNVVTYATEADCRRDIDCIDRRRKAGTATAYDAYNLYPQRLDGDRLGA